MCRQRHPIVLVGSVKAADNMAFESALQSMFSRPEEVWRTQVYAIYAPGLTGPSHLVLLIPGLY